MTGDLAGLYATIERYYTGLVLKHGPTPRGVDWTCVPSQELRFVQLLKLCDFAAPFSLNDVGCGYGGLLRHLDERHPQAKIDYLGVDLSRAMVGSGKRLWRRRGGARFVTGSASPRAADYSVASGIFNVRLDEPLERWERFVARTLRELHATSRLGFAVNFMAPLDPGQARKEGLYRTAPEPWIAFCESELGSSPQVLADYGLREFTLLSRPRRQASVGMRARSRASSGS